MIIKNINKIINIKKNITLINNDVNININVIIIKKSK